MSQIRLEQGEVPESLIPKFSKIIPQENEPADFLLYKAFYIKLILRT
jgi:hypothetical protein